jgi:hypothetical protein
MRPAGEPGATRSGSADPGQALAWYESEFAVLLAAARLTESAGFHTYAWQLAWALRPYLDRHGRWKEWVAATTQASALAADNELRDHNARAWSITGGGSRRLGGDELGRRILP